MSRTKNTSLLIAILLSISLGVGQSIFAFVDDPEFEKSTLAFAGNSRKPITNTEYAGSEYRSGKFSVSVKDGIVHVRDTDKDSVSKVDLDIDSKLVLAAAGGGVAYFVSTSDPNDENSKEENPHVRRLDLETSAWISDLTLEPKPEKDQFASVLRTFVDDEYFVAVVALFEKDDSYYDRSVKSYWVTCFEAGKSEPKWSRTFKAEKTRSRPGVYLWSASNPDYADAGLKVVSRFEDRLVISAEGKQPIRCLNIDTGTELWHCDRIWEFQRGFIGPSVWQHYIGRFRRNKIFDLGEDEEANLAKAKKLFDKSYECSIIGGPAIVALKDGGSTWRGGYSIFVAVSKQPQQALGGYLGESIIYELSDDGKVISTTNLPRLVQGSSFHFDATGVTWKCQGDQLVKLQPANQTDQMGAGPGGFDRQTDVPWIRTISAKDNRQTPAWLSAGPVCNSMKKLGRFAVSVTAGGYVQTEGDSLYQFPINVTDLESGSQKNMLLKVPFSDPIPAPKNNYSKSGNNFKTRGAYMLAITSLSIIDDRLQVVLGVTGAAQKLEFEFKREHLVEWFGVTDQNEEQEEIEIPDDLTLLDAAKDPNANRIKLLLASGADVNQRSKNGWSALMSAACYGCKDVVEVLIKNGANVDFADNNCGGQTTLMWAARSGQSSKQKVKMLIDAGADIWKKTDNGSDLLMSAAGAGNIEVVELLLELGMKPDGQSNSDYNALLAAARENSPDLIKILVKAGAEINVVDNKKRTALMVAAQGYGSGDTVRALLELGADPNLKDSDGKTALDLCLASQSIGLEKRSEILKKAMQSKE